MHILQTRVPLEHSMRDLPADVGQLAVGTAILNLYAIPRHSGGVSRVNVGTVVAGSGRNVIADEAKMEIEVRGETTEINEYMKNYAVNIIESAAKIARMHLRDEAYGRGKLPDEQ